MRVLLLDPDASARVAQLRRDQLGGLGLAGGRRRAVDGGQALDPVAKLSLVHQGGHGGAVGYPAVPEEDCIFCKIVAGELPSERVDEDEHTVSFMDINPWTRGHALVIPRRHSRNLYEIADDDLAHTMRARPSGSRSGSATASAPTA